MNIRAEITKAIDTNFPPSVQCSFRDINGMNHVFQDKAPIFTTQSISSNETFPLYGVVRCTFFKERWINGKKIITVNTKQPDDLESINGLSAFDLFENQFII